MTVDPCPLLSIVCITYQHAAFIRHSLDGFLMQQVDFPIEIIVHDDASTDGTADIVQQYVVGHPGIIIPILQSENQFKLGRKITALAMKKARGKYIALCEGDDYWTDPLKLKKQVDFLETHPDHVMAYHNASIIDDVGNIIDPSKVPLEHQRDHTSDEIQRLETFILTLSLVFRKEALFKVVPPEYLKVGNGDNFLTVLLGAHGHGKYMADIAPAMYRMHGGGVWSSQDSMARERTQLNSWMWMGAYYNRIGRQDLAEYFFARVNKRMKPMSEWYQLRNRKIYQLFARVMGWFNVTLPR